MDQGCAGQSFFPAGRGGAKKGVNQLIQKFDKSAEIVTGGFVLQYCALNKENIAFSDFYMVFLQTR